MIQKNEFFVNFQSVKEVFLTDSYLNNSTVKRYYHWLERAQLGQLECAVIKWPTLFQDNLFKNLIHETQFLQKHLVPLVKPKSYSYTENTNSSILFNLAEGHKYVPNQSFLRDLSQTVSLYLKNETKLNIADLTQIEMNPPIPRELNPLYIEKKYEARLAKENPKLRHCCFPASAGWKRAFAGPRDRTKSLMKTSSESCG